MIAVAKLEPNPKPRSRYDYCIPDSFGSIKVGLPRERAEERSGAWTQYRFELNPLVREIGYPLSATD